MFTKETIHVPPLALQFDEDIEICAVLVNDPKRPKTNPAMATAAMSVIAIRMTVARMGEMAFFLLNFSMLFTRFFQPVLTY